MAGFSTGLAGGGGGGSARGASLLTSRIARCHKSVSGSALRGIVDEDHVQAARPVRAELHLLFDIAGARRAGDEIDRARQSARHITRLAIARLGPQPVPAILIARDDLT